jgi:hypothetical protein
MLQEPAAYCTSVVLHWRSFPSGDVMVDAPCNRVPCGLSNQTARYGNEVI